jgi:hypothetical protein
LADVGVVLREPTAVVVLDAGGGGAGISKVSVVLADLTTVGRLPAFPDWVGGVASALTVSVTGVPFGGLRGPRPLIA